ncbi:hypothetical protein EVAR_80746_1 [Eumeta japonica]|uniref:Uncharacterized protein n=1 Tax=Eumeta variegata TaxID=151549 RepID=A0A4C1XAQ4_EUMVA|nr:hypothetical protein EVAR_80746_1 [Eumeta japonica]
MFQLRCVNRTGVCGYLKANLVRWRNHVHPITNRVLTRAGGRREEITPRRNAIAGNSIGGEMQPLASERKGRRLEISKASIESLAHDDGLNSSPP